MYTYNQKGLNHFSFVPGSHSLEYGPNSRAERVSWNELDQGDVFHRNSYNYSEIQIDLSKTSIMGSDSSFEPQSTLFTAVQVEIDQIKIYNHVIEECQKHNWCSSNLETDDYIIRSYEQDIIENKDGVSEDVTQERLETFRKKVATWQKPQVMSDFYFNKMGVNDTCKATFKEK